MGSGFAVQEDLDGPDRQAAMRRIDRGGRGMLATKAGDVFASPFEPTLEQLSLPIPPWFVDELILGHVID